MMLLNVVRARAQTLGVGPKRLPTFGNQMDLGWPRVDLVDGTFIWTVVDHGRVVTRYEAQLPLP